MDSDEQGSSAPGAALLLIIGEPISEDHRDAIFAEITRGFKCWDTEETGININEELANIANRASLGEDGPNGEKLIQHLSENLAVEILINPLAVTVKSSIKKLLTAAAPTKYMIYAGHAFVGSGAWILQDDTFAFNSLVQVLKSVEVETALKQNFEANLTIHTPVSDSSWGAAISRAEAANSLRIQINPTSKLDNVHGVVQFLAYVGEFVKVTPITSLLQASEQFGNISFSRPTLYIFPGCQGDSALFGISGFNLLVNGGYNRRACFWDFARHLDRVDAMLMTHLDSDNLFGLSSVLQRKTLDNIHPQIGYLYLNAIDKVAPAVDAAVGEGEKKPSTLLVNLLEEASKVTQMAKQLGISPHPCLHNSAAPSCEPINLYHKLGHGSLDMYVLNPAADSKELKEFFQAWSKQAANLGNSGPFPLQSTVSVCTLLVWKPYNYDEKIVRIFFPGNCPQHKVIEGLEKMKTSAFLKHATCTARDLMKPVAVKKSAGKPGSSSARISARSSKTENGRGAPSSARPESPRKAMSASTRAAPSSASKTSVRTSKDESIKSSRTQDKTKLESKEKKPATKPSATSGSRPSSARPTSATSATSPRKTTAQSKAPAKSPSPPKASTPSKSPSPPKAASPVKSPTPPKSSSPVKTPSPPKSPTKTKTPASPTKEKPASPQAINHANQQPESDQPPITQQEQVEALQSDLMSGSVSSSVDAQKLENLGLFSNQQKPQTNGGGDVFEAEDEDVKPQALPEPPVMVESPGQEQVGLPDYTAKIESDEQELSEFSRAEEELQDLAADSPETEGSSFRDPAQEIPPSPEPPRRDQSDEQCPQIERPLTSSGSFETPVFAHDETDLSNSGSRQEHNIQYGDKSRGHDMGGIQEVDEEEQEDEADESKESVIMAPGQAGATSQNDVYDDYEEDQVSSDCRSSVERQSEDSQQAVDEGIGEEERDLSPEVDAIEKDGDKDSIDGGSPDSEKDIDESSPHSMNGTNGAISYPDPALSNDGPNPFIGVSGDPVPKQMVGQDLGGDGSEDMPQFDPLAQWGQPMGLPSPPLGGDKKNGASSQTKPRPASASTRTGGPAARSGDGGDARKKRPETAPVGGRSSASSRPGTANTRRLASAPGKGAASKVPPLPPMTPFYVDLTYIPCHGEPAYADVEFFKRVRARYYVLSSISPSPQVLDALLEGKSAWEQKDLEVTLIPTYDNDTLRHWMGLNRDKLQELRVDMTPAVSRCTIQLQDLETSLPAYRLEV